MILDLCGGTGSWSAPYSRAGYTVLIIDPLRNWTVEYYYKLLLSGRTEVEPVTGILAAPPCTEFASAGAKHWETKDPVLLDKAIAIVRACHDIIKHFDPTWWCLENPVGRIGECCPFLGRKKATFDPWHYGDPWSKKTCLWGDFDMPKREFWHKALVPDMIDDRLHRMSGTAGRATLRSITPPRFADAFFRSNS